jgi:hypothetical protein
MDEATFTDDVEALLAMTSHTEQLQAENEELKIRLESLGNKLGALWDGVEVRRAKCPL